jgi:hypothetical protein
MDINNKCESYEYEMLDSTMSFTDLEQGREMIIFELILTTFEASSIS